MRRKLEKRKEISNHPDVVENHNSMTDVFFRAGSYLKGAVFQSGQGLTEI